MLNFLTKDNYAALCVLQGLPHLFTRINKMQISIIAQISKNDPAVAFVIIL